MYYIEEIVGVYERGTESNFDIEGDNITRHYFETKDEMIGFVVNNEFDIWNKFSYIETDELEENTHILPMFKFYEFDKVLVDVCKENGLSLDKLNGNEIEDSMFDLKEVYEDMCNKNSLPTIAQMKMMFELEYLSSSSLLKVK